jgi:hypothetical protein
VADGGVPAVGVAGRWVEVRDDFFFHYSILKKIELTSGPLSMPAHIEPAQHLQVGPPIRFSVNSRGDQCELQKITRKVVVFCN